MATYFKVMASEQHGGRSVIVGRCHASNRTQALRCLGVSRVNCDVCFVYHESRMPQDVYDPKQLATATK